MFLGYTLQASLLCICAAAMSGGFKAFWNSPVGPKTTHFWGPAANWGVVFAAVADSTKPPELISGNMTGAMCIYSLLFMRFAWVVKPRNYFLMGTHAANESIQAYQLSRWAQHNYGPREEHFKKK